MNLDEVNMERIRFDQLRNFMNFLTQSKQHEWISGKNYNLIFDAAEEATETLEKKLNLWHYLHYEMMSEKRMVWLEKYSDLPFIGKLFDIWLHYELSFQHDLIYIFCTTLTQTMAFCRHEILGEDTLQTANNGLTKAQKKHGAFHQALVPKILEEMKENWDHAREHLILIKKQFPEIVGKLEQRKAAIRIIMAQAKQIEEDVSNHYIPENDGISLKNMLSQKLQHVSSFRTLYKLTTINMEVMANTFKNVLYEHELEHLKNNSEEVTFKAGETILTKDQDALHLYILSSGEAQEIIEQGTNQDEYGKVVQQNKFKVQKGAIIGLANLIDEKVEAIYDVQAITDCECRKIDIIDLRYLFNENERFETWCYKKSLFMFIQVYHGNHNMAKMTKDEINKLSHESEL